MTDEPIKFFCEHCGQKIAVARGLAGASVRCPGCGQAAAVPVDRSNTAMVDTSGVDLGGSGPFKAGGGSTAPAAPAPAPPPGPFGGAPELPPGPAAPPPPPVTLAPPPPAPPPASPYASSGPYASSPPYASSGPYAAPTAPPVASPSGPYPVASPVPPPYGAPLSPIYAQPPPGPAPMQAAPVMQGGWVAPVPPQSNVLAIVSLVLGIASLLGFCCFGWVAGVPALITGAIALKQGQSRGMAIAGMVLGGFGLLAGMIWVIVSVANSAMR